MKNEEYMLGLFSPLSVDDEFWDKGRIDAQAIVEKTGLEEGASVLVMPVGAGAHAVAFAEAGMDVTAVGQAGPAMDIAVDRARDIGFDIDFVEAKADGYSPRRKYDLIVNLSSSFDFVSTGDEPSPQLEMLRDHLTDDGQLVLRLVSLDATQRRVQPKDWSEKAAGLLVCEEIEYDWEIGWIYYRYLIVTEDGRRYEFHLGHQGYDTSFVVDALEKSGYGSIETCGSLGGDPFDSDTPLVIFAQV